MNRYEISTPRAACGIAAVAMTVITITLSVVWPATMAESVGRDARALALSKAVTPAPKEVAISPPRIDVVSVRGQKTAFEWVRDMLTQRKQRG